jgi:hypothetical protein
MEELTLTLKDQAIKLRTFGYLLRSHRLGAKASRELEEIVFVIADYILEISDKITETTEKIDEFEFPNIK